MSKKKIEANFDNKIVAAFYEGFLAGAFYGQYAETANSFKELEDARETTLAVLNEIFDTQVDIMRSPETNEKVSAEVVAKSGDAWDMLEATVNAAIDSHNEAGEDTLATAIGMIE